MTQKSHREHLSLFSLSQLQLLQSVITSTRSIVFDMYALPLCYDNDMIIDYLNLRK